METVDYDVTDSAIDFIKRAHTANKPFFVWWNSTRMHIWTHLRPEADGKTGIGIYPDAMVEHDGHVGQLLKALDDLGIANDTIVMYSTDNGAEVMSWPDGGTTPFFGEKNTNWEGGYRVPMMLRWPGVIKPGTVVNDIGSHEDMLPTFYAAATGTTDVADKLKAGLAVGGRNFKVHLDGYDWGPLPRAGKGGAAAGLHLLDGRRRNRRPPLRPIEAGLHGAAGRRARGLGRAHGDHAAAQDHQPARRPVRARPARRHWVQALLVRPRVPARASADLRGQVAHELQGVPAAHEAGELLAGPGHGGHDPPPPTSSVVFPNTSQAAGPGPAASFLPAAQSVETNCARRARRAQAAGLLLRSRSVDL
jgi:hypothetical protein